MYKFKIPVTLAQPSNFVCGNPEIAHPHYVLQEHVTLYCISQGENTFVTDNLVREHICKRTHL